MTLLSIFKDPPPPTVKEYYEAHKEEILKLVATEHLSRTSIKDLKYHFTSLTSKKYYIFPENGQMPYMRFAKYLEYFDWFKNGINPDELRKIYASLKNSAAHIKAKKDIDIHTDNIGLMTSELDKRITHALPYYVMVNLAANYLIREDEDPQVVSPTILHEKCDDIENEIAHGNNAFFLTIPQLKPLSEIIAKSLEELNSFMIHTIQEAEKDRNYLKAYLSWTERQTAKRT